MSYAPLDDGLPMSTVSVRGGPIVLAVWAVILANKDQDGITKMTPPAIEALWSRSRTPLTLEQVQEAWDYLAAPDQGSANKEADGRRIIPTDDGRWQVVSHDKYRDRYKGSKIAQQNADRQAKKREKAKKHNFQEGSQDCLKDDLEKAAEELTADQATPQETPSQASVAVMAPICFDPPVPPKPRGNPTVAACCDIWNERYGKKSAVGGKIAGAISPLLGEYTHEEITGALKRYLAETNHPNPDPNNFREHFSDWLPTGKGAGRTGARPVVRNVTEENKQALREIQQEREGREEK